MVERTSSSHISSQLPIHCGCHVENPKSLKHVLKSHVYETVRVECKYKNACRLNVYFFPCTAAKSENSTSAEKPENSNANGNPNANAVTKDAPISPEEASNEKAKDTVPRDGQRKETKRCLEITPNDTFQRPVGDPASRGSYVESGEEVTSPLNHEERKIDANPKLEQPDGQRPTTTDHCEEYDPYRYDSGPYELSSLRMVPANIMETHSKTSSLTLSPSTERLYEDIRRGPYYQSPQEDITGATSSPSLRDELSELLLDVQDGKVLRRSRKGPSGEGQ